MIAIPFRKYSLFLSHQTPFGFKVHALITLEGYITAFEITPASVDDREGLRDIAENCLGLVILGDKGYTEELLFEELHTRGICLMSLQPSNRGLCTRLQNKILGHNLCMAFNSIFQEPCDIRKIKQAIF